MLVRVSSGASGIKEYLEEGRKKGREYHRDLIDERITLDGDIDLMGSVIDNMETLDADASKYLHITLGFAEEFTHGTSVGPGQINQDIMQAVQDRFKNDLMAAYDHNEFVWYSEAHIPKVSHDINATTGAYEERRPHIHIVIPMHNLVDGRYLNPLGFGKANLKYLDAIQEKINAEMGLKSPKDSLRANAHADGLNPLHKHNHKFAEQTPAGIREAIKTAISNGVVKNIDDLKELLRTWGEVRTRDGKDGQYLNVKPSWAAKGINLKEFTAEKIAEYKILETSTIKTDKELRDSDSVALVDKWHREASLQARFIGSGNRHIYKDFNAEEKTAMLLRLQQEARSKVEFTSLNNAKYAIRVAGEKIDNLSDEVAKRLGRRHDIKQILKKVKGINYGKTNPRTNKRPIGNDGRSTSSTNRKANLATKYRRTIKSNNRKFGEKTPAKSLDRLPDMSSIPVAHYDGTKMLLQGNARDVMDGVESVSVDGLRRDLPRRGGRGIDLDSPKSAMSKTALRQRLASLDAPFEPSADQLKADTNPILVIELAVREYHIDPSEYSIASGADGTPRIRHGKNAYNLGDFFTKHLDQSWAVAKAKLTEAYYDTLAGALPKPTAELWIGFNTWREVKEKAISEARPEVREEWRVARNSVKQEYRIDKEKVSKLRPGDRQKAMRLLRAQRLVKEENARAIAQSKLVALKPISRNSDYRIYLQERAQKGDLVALNELRRCAPEDNNSLVTKDSLTGEKSRPVFVVPNYRVNTSGQVLYMLNDSAMIADTAKSVNILKSGQDAYELAIKVAVAKYGSNLVLNGDDKFITGMMAAARKSGLSLSIARSDQPRSKPVLIVPIKSQKR